MTTPMPADALLDELRRVGDPPLDALIETAAAEIDLGKLLRDISNRRRLGRADMQQLHDEGLFTSALVEFFEPLHELPGWADPARVARGGAFFQAHGMLCLLMLASISLPACYCWQPVASALGFTGRLKTDVPRRLPETAQVVLDVEANKDLAGSENGENVGLPAIHKVRLMHSLLRYFIRHDIHVGLAAKTSSALELAMLEAKHDDAHGAPISQEHLGAVLMTFHLKVLQGLRSLGVRLDPEDVAAYLHRWNVVGYMLGVDQRLLDRMRTLEEADGLFQLMMSRNRKRTENGVRLEAALLTYMRNNIIKRIPGGNWHPVKHVPAILTHRLAGAETSDALGLHLNAEERFLNPIVWWFTRLAGWLNNFRLSRRLSNWAFRFLTKYVWDLRKGPPPGTPAPVLPDDQARVVTVPDSLANLWKL